MHGSAGTLAQSASQHLFVARHCSDSPGPAGLLVTRASPILPASTCTLPALALPAPDWQISWVQRCLCRTPDWAGQAQVWPRVQTSGAWPGVAPRKTVGVRRSLPHCQAPAGGWYGTAGSDLTTPGCFLCLCEILPHGQAPAGGWFSTAGSDPSILLRQKEDYDSAEPSATSVCSKSHLEPPIVPCTRAILLLAWLL